MIQNYNVSEGSMSGGANNDKSIHLFFSRFINTNRYNSDFIRGILGQLDRSVILCSSWDELLEKLELHPRSICFHQEELEYCSALEVVHMVETMSKLKGIDYKIPITVRITKTATYQLIKELQNSGIFGIVPSWNYYGIEETIHALKEQWSNRPYWPKHIIHSLPGYKTNKLNVDSSEIKLTPREHQIFEIVTSRGCSNKHIAKMLGLSESTVKLHLSSIFKKYGVKNRTQLALFSKL